MKSKHSAAASSSPSAPAFAAVPGQKEFPWTWDQFQRYSVLATFLEIFHKGRFPRLLDVGGLSPRRTGVGSWLPAKRVYPGNTVVLDTTFHQERGFVQGDACRLPFKSASFDVVSALDVLEHIPADLREAFISEITRVSRGSVLLSAPFQDPFIEEAEKLLFDEIMAIFGVEHRQLLEHRDCGLPEPQVVSGLLRKALPEAADVEFGYGSLRSWLYHQSLKNIFMFRKESEAIHEIMDRWMASRQDYWDFEPPFSRRFWIFSRTLSRRRLNGGVARITARLRERRPAPPSFEELLRLNRTLTDFAMKERVLAAVVTEGDSPHLEECLAHLFTQKVGFDLEVQVWDLGGGGDPGPRLEALRQKFPGLRYFEPRDRDNLRAALLELVLGSLSRFILLLADDILLPQSSVADFRNALASCPDYNLLMPKILFQEKEGLPAVNTVEYGKTEAELKFSDLLNGKPAARLGSDEADWVRSECLFFRREALAGRRLKKCVPSKKEIFLWEKEGKDRQILFIPEFIIHKCSRT